MVCVLPVAFGLRFLRVFFISKIAVLVDLASITSLSSMSGERDERKNRARCCASVATRVWHVNARSTSTP